MSYRDLEVWQLARALTLEVHRMTITSLPRLEMFEVGSQVRRSSKSVRSNIVEGYGRRRYKQEFIRFLTYALASCDETRDHLEVLWETGSLTDEGAYSRLVELTVKLGKKLHTFIASIEVGHRSVREGEQSYGAQSESCEDPQGHPASRIRYPASEEST